MQSEPDFIAQLGHYFQSNQFAEMEHLAQQMLDAFPGAAIGWKALGVSLQSQGKPAIAALQEAASRLPADPDSYYNIGNEHRRTGDHAAAIAEYRRALAINANFAAAWNNLGLCQFDSGSHREALESYRQALEHAPNFPDALNNLGVALTSLKQTPQAIPNLRRAIELQPTFVQAHNNLGVAYHDLAQTELAVSSFRRATELAPNYAEAHANLGRALKDAGQLQEAEQAYRTALRLKPDQDFVLGNWLHTRMQMCDWDGIDLPMSELMQRLAQGEAAATPFPVLALTDSRAIQRKAAETWLRVKFGSPSPHPLPKRTTGDQKRIHLAYFSGDFHQHATMYLMASLFEQHDREGFQITAFSFGPDRQDPMRARAVAAFDNFIDVSNKSDEEVVQMAREMGVDIAIDLKGYTQDSRAGIFALRAAPVQVNYLGYPGTMGAPFMDYIIADAVLIPEAHYADYAEKVIALPHSYQVNDASRVIADTPMSRKEMGLTDSAVVFCCFNNSYKIMPATFAVWMRILSKIEGSVLWLLDDNPMATANLRKHAQQFGIAAERLVFAKRVPVAEHLARHRLADLFLDTLPYNAHTTTSDALWAGLPVLTCMGESFAGRVAASLLLAIGLPELITTSMEEYEAEAIALAKSPKRLQALRTKLATNRSTAPLFDSKQFARDIEAAYRTMIASSAHDHGA